jgi:uncharacterized protein (TIGR02147 family)
MNLYQYEDYRQYLKDRFEEEKAVPGFSWRKFSAKAHISNPGFIKDVIDSRRKLSKDALQKLIKALAFLPHEAEFFQRIVAFAHTKKSEEKERIYNDIVFRRCRSNFAQLNPELTRYYQDYRYPMVRCALMAMEYKGEPSQISKFCKPSIPITVVRRIMKDLCDWGLVEVDQNGTYIVNQKFVEPSPKLGAQIRQINRRWIRIAEEALMAMEPNERHITSMLFSVSSSLRKQIAEKIERFRSEVWEMVKHDGEKHNCVMLLNSQFVPMSKRGNKL